MTPSRSLAGFLTTVQDLGRFSSQYGISSGAADPLGCGEPAVGNAENARAEMTLAGGEFAFEGDAVVALAAPISATCRWGGGGGAFGSRGAVRRRATGTARLCARVGRAADNGALVHAMTGAWTSVA